MLSYDGTDFCGWQRQQLHATASVLPSLQQTVEEALSSIFDHSVSVSASGRTDAGVHAHGQVIHFDTDRPLPQDLCWALRSRLPASIVARKYQVVPSDFHATLSALRKTYRYWIWNHPRPTALLHRYSWWLRQPLDLDFLNACAQQIQTETDFESFRSVGTPVKHTVRRIEKAVWRRRPGSSHLLEFSVTGNGFLKQMVRNLVGTQTDLYIKKRSAVEMSQIVAAKDRRAAGPAAPPQGLFLVNVEYPRIYGTGRRA